MNGRLPTKVIKSLFDSMFKVLKAENETLEGARRRVPKNSKRWERNSQGLPYWVYEATLVYAVFKEWSRRGHDVEWEWPYPGQKKKPRTPPPGAVPTSGRADLVLFNGDDPQAVFEFKWWNAETAKVHAAVSRDIAKMRRWRGIPDRFLVATWWSPESDRKKDLKPVQTVVGPLKGRVLYTDYFKTHEVGNKDCDFAVALIRV